MKTLTLVVLAVGLCLLPVRSESQARPALTPEDVKQINELTRGLREGHSREGVEDRQRSLR